MKNKTLIAREIPDRADGVTAGYRASAMSMSEMVARAVAAGHPVTFVRATDLPEHHSVTNAKNLAVARKRGARATRKAQAAAGSRKRVRELAA